MPDQGPTDDHDAMLHDALAGQSDVNGPDDGDGHGMAGHEGMVDHSEQAHKKAAEEAAVTRSAEQPPPVRSVEKLGEDVSDATFTMPPETRSTCAK